MIILSIRTSFATIDHPNVGQFGVYKLKCDNEQCSFEEIQEAVNIHLCTKQKHYTFSKHISINRFTFAAILFFLLIIIGAVLTIFSLNWTITKYRRRAATPSRNIEEIPAVSISGSPSVENGLDKPDQPASVRQRPRLRSLDTFRGAVIVLMIFVNSGGGHFWWMEHATWNGLHVADVVFPCFLWIMGVCLPLSLRSQLARAVPRRQLMWQIFKVNLNGGGEVKSIDIII